MDENINKKLSEKLNEIYKQSLLKPDINSDYIQVNQNTEDIIHKVMLSINETLNANISLNLSNSQTQQHNPSVNTNIDINTNSSQLMPNIIIEDNDVLITSDDIHSCVSVPLQVRRGSEPVLNRFSPDIDITNELDQSKRWSTAVAIDSKNNRNASTHSLVSVLFCLTYTDSNQMSLVYRTQALVRHQMTRGIDLFTQTPYRREVLKKRVMAVKRSLRTLTLPPLPQAITHFLDFPEGPEGSQ